MQYNDVDVINAAIKDNDFLPMVTIYEKNIYNLCLSMTRDCKAAEDLTQEVFIKIYKYIRSFKGDSALKTWIYRITMNTCKDYLKKMSSYKTAYIPEDKEVEDIIKDYFSVFFVEDIVLKKEVASLIMSKLDNLKKEHKEILILREIHQLSYQEISDILKIPQGTVKSQINRARNLLKKELIPHLQH